MHTDRDKRAKNERKIYFASKMMLLMPPPPSFFHLSVLPLDRYTDVTCTSESGKSSVLNLGLLDFGASYTVILTEVWMLSTQLPFHCIHHKSQQPYDVTNLLRVSCQESGEIVARKIQDVKANNVHIAYQIPQYVLITAGEVMFSITGLEFSYSQVMQHTQFSVSSILH